MSCESQNYLIKCVVKIEFWRQLEGNKRKTTKNRTTPRTPMTIIYYICVNQIDTIFMDWSIVLSCVKKSLDLGMKSNIPEWNVQCLSYYDNLEQGGMVVHINWMTTIVFVFLPQFHAIDAIITPKSKCRCFYGIASASRAIGLKAVMVVIVW
jgi:hypothetical protein